MEGMRAVLGVRSGNLSLPTPSAIFQHILMSRCARKSGRVMGLFRRKSQKWAHLNTEVSLTSSLEKFRTKLLKFMEINLSILLKIRMLSKLSLKPSRRAFEKPISSQLASKP